MGGLSMIICVWKPNNSREVARLLGSGMAWLFEACRVSALSGAHYIFPRLSRP